MQFSLWQTALSMQSAVSHKQVAWGALKIVSRSSPYELKRQGDWRFSFTAIVETQISHPGAHQ